MRVPYTLLVLDRESGKSRVLIVIKSRAVKLVGAALGSHTDAGNASVLSTEIVGKNIQFPDSFKGWRTRGGAAVERAGRALPIDGEVRTIALKSQKLK